MVARWKVRTALFLAVVAMVLLPSTAQAYVGPGGVLTAIGALLALVVALGAAFAGFLWYPLKRLLTWVRRARGRNDPRQPAATSENVGG